MIDTSKTKVTFTKIDSSCMWEGSSPTSNDVGNESQVLQVQLVQPPSLYKYVMEIQIYGQPVEPKLTRLIDLLSDLQFMLCSTVFISLPGVTAVFSSFHFV